MTISIITPLHEPGNKFIMETYASLQAQTLAEWEWLILENHGGSVPAALRNDPRVRAVQAEPRLHGIGALKRRCCELASGDIVVELDADDQLTPTCLERVAAAVADGADFVHSNCAEYESGSWKPQVYSEVFGWEHRPFEWQGRTLQQMVAPPVTPQSIRFVYWSPNHVRAWTRKAYWEVGGHDPTMPVADDHDLVVRFALAGKKMVRLDECLYLYRVHPQNNVKTQNALIQTGTNRVYERYVWQLAEWFSRANSLLRIDLGGAIDCPAGYAPMDLNSDPPCDLDLEWPLDDSCVGVLRAQDILEHLKDPVHVMNEAYRVLAPGGWFMINVPSALGQGAFQDPTHKSFWVRNSFLYYTNRRYSRYIPDFKGRFAVSRITEWYPSQWHRDNNVPYIGAQLIALKDGYHHMGLVEI